MFLEILWRGIVESEGGNELLADTLRLGFSVDGQQRRRVASIGLGGDKDIAGCGLLALDVAGIFRRVIYAHIERAPDGLFAIYSGIECNLFVRLLMRRSNVLSMEVITMVCFR